MMMTTRSHRDEDQPPPRPLVQSHIWFRHFGDAKSIFLCICSFPCVTHCIQQLMNLYLHCVIYGNGTCISKYIVACFVLYIVMPGVLPWAVKTCPGGSSLIVIHTNPSVLKIMLNDLSKMTLKHSFKNFQEIDNFENKMKMLTTLFVQAGVIQPRGISTTDTGIAFRKIAK